MKKAKVARATPAMGGRSRPSELAVYVFIVVFTLWQGAYFPLQFLLMLVFLFGSFVIFGRSLVVTRQALMLFALFCLYVVSLFVFSENQYVGMIEVLRCLVFPLTLILFHNFNSEWSEKAIFSALIIVAILGLLALARIISIPGGVIEHNNRLQSVIQYANTTALLMLVGALFAIDRFISKRKAASLVYCALFLITLILTGSRTTFVVALAVFALYAFVLAGRRGKLIAVGSLVIAAAIVACLGVFTDVRLFQIALYEPTLVERWITYGDAVSMMKGRWISGIGVGNWQTWQYGLQSAPYSVKFIHNHFLQMLLDGGLFAVLLFCAAFIPAILKGLWEKSIHSIILVAVLLHAVFDFDLIFCAVAMISTFSLSELTKAATHDDNAVTGKDKKHSSKSKTLSIAEKEQVAGFSDLDRKLSTINRLIKFIKAKWLYGFSIKFGKLRYIALIPLLGIAILWCSEVFYAVADANLERERFEKAMNGYEAALALNPLNTVLYYQMAQSTRDIILTEDLIRACIEKNPNELNAVSILALIESRNGNHESALELCERLLEIRRFSKEHSSLYLEIADRAVAAGVISSRDLEHIEDKIEAIHNSANPLYKQYIER